MMPRIRPVSGLASRRSSTSSLVTIADDEMPTMPAITSVSRPPQPSAKPEARPEADVEHQVDAAGQQQLAPAGDQVVERRTPGPGGTAAGRARGWPAGRGRPGRSTSTGPGVCGPGEDAGGHEQGDGRQAEAPAGAGQERRPPGRRRRGRPAPAHLDAAASSPSAGAGHPATWLTKPARSSGRPMTTSRSPGVEHLGGLGRRRSTVVAPQDGDDGHAGVAGGPRGRRSSWPTPGESVRMVTQSMSRPPTTASICAGDRGLEVGAGEDGAEPAGLVVGEGDDRRRRATGRRRRRRGRAGRCGG